MEPYWREQFGNAGALHEEGRQAKAAVETARRTCAEVIGAQADEIVFTSGGTEANNLAIFGLIKSLEAAGRTLSDMHFVTSAIEHSSVLDCFRELEAAGASVTIVPVGEDGVVSSTAIGDAINEKTVLVSVMYVNSEIGTVMPLGAISKALKSKMQAEHHIYFHTDASQAPALLPCNTEELGVDFMSLDGQKVYGPKGVGCLFVRRNVPIRPIMFGGNQERGLRPGTPVTPLIIGFSKALEISEEVRGEVAKRIQEMRDSLIERILEAFPGSVLNGSLESRSPGNINVSIPGCDGEYLVLALDAIGIAISTRSACLFGESPGSRVVRALYQTQAQQGEGDWQAQAAIRITLGRPTTNDDIERFFSALQEVVQIAKEPTRQAVINTVEA
jgi:cysteine desulfurase